jgi:hypothetical protein
MGDSKLAGQEAASGGCMTESFLHHHRILRHSQISSGVPFSLILSTFSVGQYPQ